MIKLIQAVLGKAMKLYRSETLSWFGNGDEAILKFCKKTASCFGQGHNVIWKLHGKAPSSIRQDLKVMLKLREKIIANGEITSFTRQKQSICTRRYRDVLDKIMKLYLIDFSCHICRGWYIIFTLTCAYYIHTLT